MLKAPHSARAGAERPLPAVPRHHPNGLPDTPEPPLPQEPGTSPGLAAVPPRGAQEHCEGQGTSCAGHCWTEATGGGEALPFPQDRALLPSRVAPGDLGAPTLLLSPAVFLLRSQACLSPTPAPPASVQPTSSLEGAQPWWREPSPPLAQGPLPLGSCPGRGGACLDLTAPGELTVTIHPPWPQASVAWPPESSSRRPLEPPPRWGPHLPRGSQLLQWQPDGLGRGTRGARAGSQGPCWAALPAGQCCLSAQTHRPHQPDA